MSRKTRRRRVAPSHEQQEASPLHVALSVASWQQGWGGRLLVAIVTNTEKENIMSFDHHQKEVQAWFAHPDNHAIIDIHIQKVVYPYPVALVWTQWDHVRMPKGQFVSLQITVYLAETRRDSYASCSIYDRQTPRWVEVNRIEASRLKTVEASQGKKIAERFDDGEIDDEDLRTAFQGDVDQVRSIALQILTSPYSSRGYERELIIALSDIRQQVERLAARVEKQGLEEEAPVHGEYLHQLALFAYEPLKARLYPHVYSLDQAKDLIHPDSLRLVVEDTRDDLRFSAALRQEWLDLSRRLHEVCTWWDAGMTAFRERLEKQLTSIDEPSAAALADYETADMMGTTQAFAYSAEFEQQLWYLGGWLFQWRETFQVSKDEAGK